jgi:hypothetical protein
VPCRQEQSLSHPLGFVASPETGVAALVGVAVTSRNGQQMAPKQIEIVRRAYKLWQENGQPDGKDDEFYYQAEREIEQEEMEDISKEPPPTILPG